MGEGATPFPGLFHFTLDPYLIMLRVKQGGIKYHFFKNFLVFHMTRPKIEPGPLANTLLIWPIARYIQQLCEDTGCNPEDQPKAMNDREK